MTNVPLPAKGRRGKGPRTRKAAVRRVERRRQEAEADRLDRIAARRASRVEAHEDDRQYRLAAQAAAVSPYRRPRATTE